jgi:hypothetical protein
MLTNSLKQIEIDCCGNLKLFVSAFQIEARKVFRMHLNRLLFSAISAIKKYFFMITEES